MNEKYLTTVELYKESMKFSAGHITVFSAVDRENLHGHLYTVYLALTTWVSDNGLTFDYRYYKKKINHLCSYLNQTFLMPQYSPYLRYEEDDFYYHFYFNNEHLQFLKRDITLLPVTNITVEELSKWFIGELVKDKQELIIHRLEKIVVKVFSAPGQCASHEWRKNYENSANMRIEY